MLSYANKFLFALAGFAFVAFLGYSAAVGERSGAFLLLGLCFGAVAVGLVVTGATISEALPAVEDADAPVEYRSVDPTSVARPTPWPLVTALALGLAGVGAAVDGKLMVVGLVVGLVPAAGWLGQVWREHAGWTPRLSERLDDRVLVPIALPVGMILLVGAIAISVSRVLLALPEKGSTAGALVIAIVVLFGLALIAARLPQLRTSALIAVAVFAAVTVVAAGSVGAATGERTFEHKGEGGTPIVDVTAQNTAFNQRTITVPAKASKFRIVFVNKDTGTYHNVAVYTTDGKPLFNGKPVPKGKVAYDLTPPPPGTYQFLCDFHASIMKGDFVVK